MLQKIAGWFMGYVVFTVNGKFPERFFNLCASKRRDIWNVRKSNGIYYACSRIKEYKNFRKDARVCNVRLKIKNKIGFPFFIHKNRYRYGMFVGIFLCIALIWFLSMFVWSVEIKGNDSLSQKEILSTLKNNGVCTGAYIPKLDFKKIKQTIMIENPKIASVSFTLEGTTVYVDISESEPAERKDDSPSDIIATCDGVIKRMNVHSGKALVKEGDGVVKGDTLVTGKLEYENGIVLYKHSDAEIIATTEHTLNTVINLQKEEEIPTGDTVSKKILHFFHLNIPLGFEKIKQPYQIETRENFIKISNSVLPIGITENKYHITKKTVRTLSQDEAISIGKGILNQQISENNPNIVVINCMYSTEFRDNELYIKGNFICEENIIFNKKLLIF